MISSYHDLNVIVYHKTEGCDFVIKLSSFIKLSLCNLCMLRPLLIFSVLSESVSDKKPSTFFENHVTLLLRFILNRKSALYSVSDTFLTLLILI